jgi:DNA-binding MarR family transcriptional regulator
VLSSRIVSDSDDRQQVEAIADALYKTDHLVRSRVYRGRLTGIAGVELGPSGYSILTSLESDGAQRLIDLAEQFSLDQSTISRRVAALERLGYVARQTDERDKRASLISISSAGRKALRRRRSAILTSLTALIEEWSPEERRTLAEGLSKFAASLAAAVREARNGPEPSDG